MVNIISSMNTNISFLSSEIQFFGINKGYDINFTSQIYKCLNLVKVFLEIDEISNIKDILKNFHVITSY